MAVVRGNGERGDAVGAKDVVCVWLRCSNSMVQNIEEGMVLFKQPRWAVVVVVTLLMGLLASPALAKTEIEIWLGGEPGMVSIFDTLTKQYMETNPDVEITVTFVGSDLLNPALVPALSAGEGPDIFRFGTGPGQPAAIIEGGLVKDLTHYYTAYGWDKVIPENVVNYTSSNGKLWAVGDEVENTLMFYNKQIFADLGLDVPTTMEEFTKLVDTLMDAGYEIPIGLGGADKWPISHWQSMLFGRFAGPEGIDRVMFGDGRWDEPEFVEASRLLQDMAKKGYFGDNPLANGFAEIMEVFWRGEIPMTFTGPWVIGEAINFLGEDIANFGVLQIPPLADGQKIYPTEDIGSGWYINAATEDPDLAAEIIDFLLFRRESRAQLLASGEDIPVGPIDDLLDEVEMPALREEMIALVDRDRGNGTVHSFLDTVQPQNVTNITYDGLQALLIGMVTPEEFVAEIQREWDIAKARGTILKPGGLR